MDITLELKKLVRNLPCWSCIVRPTCVSFLETGHIEVTSFCDKWTEWRKERDKIIAYWDPVMAEAITEIRQEEKIDQMDQ